MCLVPSVFCYIISCLRRLALTCVDMYIIYECKFGKNKNFSSAEQSHLLGTLCRVFKLSGLIKADLLLLLH